MRVSDKGLRFIARWEGFRSTAYKAHPNEKYLTIGYGHYGPDVTSGERITEARALKLLRKDAAVAEGAVDKYVKVPLTQGQFDALVSFTFNVGVGGLRSSTLLRLLNRGRKRTVPRQLLRWVMVGPIVLQGLVRRRRAEGRKWRRSRRRRKK